MRTSTKVILSIVLAVCVAVFLFAGYQLFSILNEYKQARDYYDGMADTYASTEQPAEHTPEPSPIGTPAADPNADAAQIGEASVEDEKEYSPLSVDFDKLLSVNDEVCGWIYSPDTAINYVIAQAEDNNQYLHHLLDDTYSEGGTLFMDCECAPNFAGANSIIYGHNMRDGSMFRSLTSYREQSYYDAHPVLYLNTPTQNYKIEVFTAYTCNYDSDTYMLSFASEQDYMDYLTKMKSQSDFECDVMPTSSERVITLSTCTYEYDNARYVVQGKLIPLDMPPAEQPAA